MIARTTDRFRKSFAKLPDPIKEKARKAYALWRQDPYHSSLNYKQIHKVRPIYSVRIGYFHRAIGVKENETLIWFWIGSHEDYNNLINQL